jgi:serine/threonine protein kinase
MSGTPEFVSPEVVNYDPISLASDTWSLGVIAYVLLSGLSPFMGDTVVETYSNVSRGEYDFDEPEFDVISPAAKDFISALLVKDKTQRLSADECLGHRWLRGADLDNDEDENMTRNKIDKTNLKKYLARRRWQRYGQAIRYFFDLIRRPLECCQNLGNDVIIISGP